MIQALTNNWKEFADRFIPQNEESIIFVQKNRDQCYMLDLDRVIERTRNLTMIRNNLHSSNIRRNFKECTAEEIAESKYNKLMSLLERRPELKELVNARL